MTTTAPTLDPAVFESFDSVQRRTRTLLRTTIDRVEAGMSERDIADLALALGAEQGFTDWFHRPHVHIGSRAHIDRQNSPRQKLAKGDIVEIDLGPATAEAFGDLGVAFAFGATEEPKLIADARELVKACVGFSSRWKCTGEVFVYATAWANNRRYSLGRHASIGHICLPPGGWGWPKTAWAATLMRRNQVQWFNPRRMAGFFALRPRLVDGDSGCAFEEMVFIDGDVKRIVGRDSVDEMGTY